MANSVHKKEEKDKHKTTIVDLLKAHKDGLTITEIMKKTDLARHTVLARLHNLEGKGSVELRQINMAKLYKWIDNGDKEGQNEQKDSKESKEPKEKHEKLKHEIKLTNLKEEHLRIAEKPKQTPKQTKEKQESSGKGKINMALLKAEIMKEMSSGKLEKHHAQIKEQREPIVHAMNGKKMTSKGKKEFVTTGVPGFDDLLVNGIPKGNAVLVAGGAGSGKTIFCLQTLAHHAANGKKCLYMSFEESEEHLTEHMEDFGWNPKELIKKGNLLLKRFNPFDITRSVDALLMKAKGELLIEVDPIIFPEGFKPDFIVVDSLTAIASAFTGKEDSYRIYIEQLFRFFEQIGATSFLITETKQIPTIFSQTGVEEFLADGVIVLYNIKRGNVRENAIEILKLRGAEHQKKIVAFEITGQGMIVYPEQEVFGEIGNKE